jgi:hypothetical protein
MTAQGKKKILHDGMCMDSSSVYTCRRGVSLFLQCTLAQLCIRRLVLQTRIATIETRTCMNPSKHIDVHLRHIVPCRPPRAGMPA